MVGPCGGAFGLAGVLEAGTPTPHGSCRPIGVGLREVSTALKELYPMHRTTQGTLARFTIYRTLRRFAGPLLAFRLAFTKRVGA